MLYVTSFSSRSLKRSALPHFHILELITELIDSIHTYRGAPTLSFIEMLREELAMNKNSSFPTSTHDEVMII
jgi:hypothetical protein